MPSFEEVLTLPDAELKERLRRVRDGALALALVGAPEAAILKISANLSAVRRSVLSAAAEEARRAAPEAQEAARGTVLRILFRQEEGSLQPTRSDYQNALRKLSKTHPFWKEAAEERRASAAASYIRRLLRGE